MTRSQVLWPARSQTWAGDEHGRTDDCGRPARVLVWLGHELWLRWHTRTAEREELLLIELEALRAAQRMSLKAWETRQAMLEEVRRHEKKDP